MKINFDYKTFYKCFIFFILMLWPFRWDNYHFILVSLIGVVYSLLFLKEKEYELRYFFYDIGWFIFILTGILSYFWATNSSLVWSPIFNWGSLIIWSFLVRALFSKGGSYTTATKQGFNILILGLSFQIIFFIFIYHIKQPIIIDLFQENLKWLETLGVTPKKIILNDSFIWNKFFGSNANFTSIYCLSLFPFLLFTNYSDSFIFEKILKIIFIPLLITLIYLSKAMGTGITFLLVICFYMFNAGLIKYLLFGFFSSILLLIFFYFIDFDFLSSLDSIAGVSTRGELIYRSFRIFIEDPFLGVGIGNWHLETYNLDNISYFNYPYLMDPVGNHDIYSLLLSELGIIGFLSFLFPIGAIILSAYNTHQEMTNFEKAAFSSLLIYLIASFFYQTANCQPNIFSKVHLLAFFNIGVLSSRFKGGFTKYKLNKIILLILSSICLSWFIYDTLVFKKYVGIQQLVTENQNKEAIKKFEKLYNPIFKTTHKVHELIDLELARLYIKEEQFNRSEYHFNRALKLSPFHQPTLVEYSRFLLKIRKDSEKAIVYVSKLNDNLYAKKVLMAEIAISENRYKEAIIFLNRIDDNRYRYDLRKALQKMIKKGLINDKSGIIDSLNLLKPL